MYLEGMEEASVFVHVTVNDITGKVGRERLSSVAKRQNVTCGFRWVEPGVRSAGWSLVWVLLGGAWCG